MESNIYEKIEKCLNLAASFEYNPHEAENALRAAKRLAEQYGLDLAEIEANLQQTTSDKVTYTIEEQAENDLYGYVKPWERNLVMFAAKLCSSFVYLKGNTSKCKIIFVGTKQDIALAIEVYRYFRKKIMKMACEKNREIFEFNKASYCLGFSYSLLSRLDKQEKEKVSTGTDLVLVNKEQQIEDYKEQKLNLRKTRTRQQIIDDESFNYGHADGQQENLNFKDSLA